MYGAIVFFNFLSDHQDQFTRLFHLEAVGSH